jgi:hypothetical protein
MKTVRDFVEEVMREDERSRNDDKWLIIQTLRKMGFDVYIDYDQLEELPAFETITRCRRKIQEEGELQADSEVRKVRSENEEEMKDINKWWGDGSSSSSDSDDDIPVIQPQQKTAERRT